MRTGKAARIDIHGVQKNGTKNRPPIGENVEISEQQRKRKKKKEGRRGGRRCLGGGDTKRSPVARMTGRTPVSSKKREGGSLDRAEGCTKSVLTAQGGKGDHCCSWSEGKGGGTQVRFPMNAAGKKEKACAEMRPKLENTCAPQNLPKKRKKRRNWAFLLKNRGEFLTAVVDHDIETFASRLQRIKKKRERGGNPSATPQVPPSHCG